MMMTGWKTRQALAVLLAMLIPACATTNIQTGGSNVTGPERSEFGSDNPEEAFFTDLSEQDPAFQDGKQPEQSYVAEEAAESDCPCDNNETVAANTEDRNTVLNDRRDSYFTDNQVVENSGTAAQEEQPIDQNMVADQNPPEENTNNAGDGNYSNELNGNFFQVGTASWYGRDFDGKPTASGETFDSRKLTAAHRDLPLGSIVLVRNMENNKEVLVTVNDRGPYVNGRVLDMSEYGAELLGYKEQGLTRVGIRVIRVGQASNESDKGATYEFFGAGFDPQAGGGDVDTEQRTREVLEADQRKQEEEEYTPVLKENDFSSYTVQVGIFSDLRNARNLQRYLSHYGYPVHVFERENMFVVKMGTFDSRDPADRLKHQLQMDGYRAFISEPMK
ncbi:MAG: septal ring lytic transglycosylase RlpA family protein [Leptospiraceae bacterium]|nr:septal ring lytic transglycosylase RlpA family protein [Leptospiraceae bacterium]